VEFRPTLGLARCRLAGSPAPITPRLIIAPAPAPVAATGDVEFF
jgi:chemotaxis protein CheD